MGCKNEAPQRSTRLKFKRLLACQKLGKRITEIMFHKPTTQFVQITLKSTQNSLFQLDQFSMHPAKSYFFNGIMVVGLNFLWYRTKLCNSLYSAVLLR